MRQTDALVRQMQRIRVIRTTMSDDVAHAIQKRSIKSSGESRDSAHGHVMATTAAHHRASRLDASSRDPYGA